MGNRTLIPNPTPAVPGGGMTLISETTASTITELLLSGIPQTYKQLMLVWSGIFHSATGNGWTIRFNNDDQNAYNNSTIESRNGSITQVLQLTNAVRGAGESQPFGNNTNTSDLQDMARGFLLIDNYSSSTKFKTYKYSYGHRVISNSNFEHVENAGYYSDVTARTSLGIRRSSGSGTFSNTTNTSIRLYGIS